MDYAWALLLILTLLVGWILTVLAMPGNWLMVGAVAAYAWLGPTTGRLAIGWETVAAMTVVALLGELAEFLAGMFGVARAGGSRRSAVLALVGSLAGGLIGIVVGVPVPVVGQLIAAVAFAGCGAAIGAVLGEQWAGRDIDGSIRVGAAAFWGRLLGTLAKMLAGTAMVVIGAAALMTSW